MQPGKLAQDRGFGEGLFHRRIAVAEPILHQMNPQHGHPRIRRTTAFALWVKQLDQRNQAFLGHDLIPLNQEALTTGLLTFASVLGISEVHLLHRGLTIQFVGQVNFTKV